MRARYLAMATLMLAGWMLPAGPTAGLNVRASGRFGSNPLRFDAPCHSIASGQVVAVTRLDLLLCDVALRREDGTWLELPSWQAFFNLREETSVSPSLEVPAATYDRVRFAVGVPPELNHADPAQWPAGHALNPVVNGLHWSWQGGYVFLALEGRWSPADGSTHGYSWHLATDPQLAQIELPVALELDSPTTLTLTLDVANLFARPTMVTLDEKSASTHSRANDALADHLRESLATAFSAAAAPASGLAAPQASGSPQLETDRQITPYRMGASRYLAKPALPADNPPTAEGVLLGSVLFFDPRLSGNDSQSCASCHRPEAAFTDCGRAKSLGADGQPGERNAMPLFNLAWKSAFLWDGRARTLREQVLQPIENPLEMHASLPRVIERLRGLQVNHRHAERAVRHAGLEPDSPTARHLVDVAAARRAEYRELFAWAFGTPEVTAERLARALEQFVITRVSFDSKFDRALRGEAHLTPLEQRGAELFHTEYDPRQRQYGADCFHCHGGPLFRSQAFANNGLDAVPADPGRFAVTGRLGDQGKFAVPSLRNVALTAPYMHDGRFVTLEEVVRHYVSGVQRSETLDPNLLKHPPGGVPLSDADQAALVAFLRTLTEVETPDPRPRADAPR